MTDPLSGEPHEKQRWVFSLILTLFFYHVCVCVCVHPQVIVCSCGGQRFLSGVLLLLSNLIFGTGSLTRLGTHHWLDWTSSRPWRAICLHQPVIPSGLCGAGDLNSYLSIHSWCFTYWAFSTAPFYRSWLQPQVQVVTTKKSVPWARRCWLCELAWDQSLIITCDSCCYKH